MQQHPDNSYDKSKMQSKNGILQFQFGEYPAIGILHFEERRDERTRIKRDCNEWYQTG